MAILVKQAVPECQAELRQGTLRHVGEGDYNWFYDEKTVCYIEEGEVVVDEHGAKVFLSSGDVATFPKGLRCDWHVSSPARIYVCLKE